jgi:hypothetical protein
MVTDDMIICVGCNKKPSELDEYISMAEEMVLSPEDYVRQEEGTFNPINGHFMCIDCYIKAGMPSSLEGWVAP